MKNLLKEVILLLLISFFIVDCEKKVQIIERPPTFYPFYFATKKPTEEDLIILRNYYYNYKYSQTFRNEVGILIGAYYFKKGSYEESKLYIEKNIDNPHLSGLLKILGNCFLLDIYMRQNNLNKAKQLYNKIISFKGYIDYENALRGYCASTLGSFKDINNNCFTNKVKTLLAMDNQLQNKEDFIRIEQYNEGKDNITVEQEKPLKENKYKIMLNKIAVGENLISGLMFALYKNNLNYEVYTQGSFNVDFDCIIDKVENSYVLKYNNKVIDFSWDYEQLFDYFCTTNSNIFQDKAIIAINDGYEKLADSFKQKLLRNKPHMKVHIIKYSEEGYRDDLEYLKKIWGDDVLFIGIGTEMDMTNVMPMVRFVFRPDTDAYLFIDCFTGLYFNRYYKDYFNHSFIYCYSNLVEDAYEEELYRELKSFCGENVTGETVIGYDMIKYLSQEDNASFEGFLSSFKGVDSLKKKVIREPLLYYIKNRHALRYN